MLRGQSPMAVAPLLDPWTKRKRRFGEEAEEEVEEEGEEQKVHTYSVCVWL